LGLAAEEVEELDAPEAFFFFALIAGFKPSCLRSSED
jgi:hypothetical protein